MPQTIFQGRRAVSIENQDLRVAVLIEGGHIAEVFDKRAGVNPMWIPPWPSIEHSEYDPAKHSIYGGGAGGKLLAGIMGHNLCLDLFGGPDAEEAAAGITYHGEASVVAYDIKESTGGLHLSAEFPLAQIKFERRMSLHGRRVKIHEAVENLCAFDRPFGWTQHATLGPPFLHKDQGRLTSSATRSKVLETKFGVADYLKAGAEFDWPRAPLADPGTESYADLSMSHGRATASAYTAHLMDPSKEHAFFAAFSPAHKLAIAYVWKQADFPWMGIWEEKYSRTQSPWNGQTLARGMEFGMSPMPESRRAMIDRGPLFGTRTYGWLPAKTRLETEYWILTMSTDAAPETVAWPT